MWKKIDNILNKLAKWLILAFIVYVLWMIAKPAIIGRYMLYEKTYNESQNQ